MARYNRGWVKLHRDIKDHFIWNDPVLALLFVNLLIMANYKESEILWCGNPRKLYPGDVLTGLEELAAKVGCSKTTISRKLILLQSCNIIGTEVGNGGTIVSICNWSRFQNTEEEGGTQMGNGWETDGKRMGTHKELKKERNSTVADSSFEKKEINYYSSILSKEKDSEAFSLFEFYEKRLLEKNLKLRETFAQTRHVFEKMLAVHKIDICRKIIVDYFSESSPKLTEESYPAPWLLQKHRLQPTGQSNQTNRSTVKTPLTILESIPTPL